jgi:hypothetical protein
MLGGTTRIDLPTRQGHPTGRTGRWSSPSSYIMLIYKKKFITNDIISR